MGAPGRLWSRAALLVLALAGGGCSVPGIRQQAPLLPVPVARPALSLDVDLSPSIPDEEHTVLVFRGRLVDRVDPGAADRSRSRPARVSLVFEVQDGLSGPPPPDDTLPPEAPRQETLVARLGVSAPFDVLPVLRVGATWELRWSTRTVDPLAGTDLLLEIRTADGVPVYLMASGAELPEEPLLPGLELRRARQASFITDFEALAGCRVRRRHYATRVATALLEGGEAWLLPSESVDVPLDDGIWRITVLDNSAALKGGCDRLISQEMAHRTVVLQRQE
ncbi:MAG: hypothetical protein FJ098_08045 [Deltaproteobacteria bacterium]|nr:hypothetical protein [Deltaproteobacteria bacterium]